MHGPEVADVSALLLTLTGRLEPAEGIAKVDGLMLPERSATVRRRASYVNLDLASTDAVTEAVAERPRLLVVDRTELVGDPAERDALAALLTRARTEDGVTVVLGAVGPAMLDPLTALAPAGAPVLALDLHAAGGPAPAASTTAPSPATPATAH